MSDHEELPLRDDTTLDNMCMPPRGPSLLKFRRCLLEALLVSVVLAIAFFILLLQWGPPPRVLTETTVSSRILDDADTTTISVDAGIGILLHPDAHVSRAPRIQRFAWNITKSAIAPDGFRKDVFLINGRVFLSQMVTGKQHDCFRVASWLTLAPGEFPGPTIEARDGDTLEIKIVNQCADAMSLHWHGLHMRDANHMDGPVGITQCPIPSGETFIYRVPIANQSGTFWYHAHSEVQRADGLYGGLVIHAPTAHDHDGDLLLMVGDWYHWPASDVLQRYMSQTSQGDEPLPDSILINGRGYFDCSKLPHVSKGSCTEADRPWISLDAKGSYRIRVVNVGSLTGFTLTIPDSRLQTVEVDGGQPVLSHVANSIGVLYPAQRVDFILRWSEPISSESAVMMIELDPGYLTESYNPALDSKQSFSLTSSNSPQQGPWPDIETTRFDLHTARGPALPQPLPPPERVFMVYAATEILRQEGYIPKGFLNRTTWEPQKVPLIALGRSSWDDHQLVPWTGREPTWVELTINNIDSTGHPFHLHGFDFYVLTSYEGKGGWDYYSPFDAEPPRGGPLNLGDPVRRDTVLVPAWGYVVVRFLADSEGIWALHCHVMWHQASGMTMAFQVLGDEQKGLSGTSSGLHAKDLCRF